MIKKIMYIIAAAFLVLGVVGTIVDKKDTTAEFERVKEYPVITPAQIEEYKKFESQKVVVTNIEISGSLVEDEKGIWEGEYYYLHGEAKVYDIDSDGYGVWYSESDMDYECVGENLTTNILPDQEFIPKEQVFYINTVGSGYLKNVDENNIQVGNKKYIYRALGTGDRLTALMTIGDGEAKLETLLDRDTENYIQGDENTYYDHVEAFVVGDSYLLVCTGVAMALIFAAIGTIIGTKKKGAELSNIPDEEKEPGIKERYARLSPEEKKKFWIFRISGAVVTILGLAIIIICYDNMTRLIFGTIILIVGASLWASAFPIVNDVN